MKEYKCDICGKKLTEENGLIKEGQGTVKFPVPKKAKDSPNYYAGLDFTLKSNSLNDVCKACVLKAVKASFNY